MSELLGALGNPELGMRGVLVAGTNGKGSVCALIASMCQAAGLATAQLSQPHLVDWTERILINGNPVSHGEFEDLWVRVNAAAATLVSGVGPALQSEMLLAMGLLAAHDAGTDILVCEVGLGGRLDASNVLDLGTCVVTSIALDHTAILGVTLEAIAAEKAAIIKPGNAVVTACEAPSLAVIREFAEQTKAASCCVIDDHWVTTERSDRAGVAIAATFPDQVVRASTPLLGRHQARNLAIAVATCRALNAPTLDSAAIQRGAANVVWPGRLQLILGKPDVILDGAHNPAAMAALRDALGELYPGRPHRAIFGALSDKAVAEMLAVLRDIDATPVFTRVPSARAVAPAELRASFGTGATTAADFDAALTQARASLADAGAQAHGVVVVCGSLALVGAALENLSPRPGKLP